MNTAVSRKEISLLREGHRITEKIVFMRLFPSVLRACKHYSFDQMLAEDAAAAAFLRAYTSLERFVWHHEGSFFAWVRKIAVREALYEMRKNRPFLDIADSDMASEKPGEQTEMKLDAKTALKLLDRLAPAQKAIFLLIHLEGFSHADAADCLGITENNSKQLFHRARLRLMELLNQNKTERHGKLGS